MGGGSFLPVLGRQDPDQVSSLTSQTDVEILAQILSFSSLFEATAGGSEGGGCVSYCMVILRCNNNYVIIGSHFYSVSKAGTCSTRTTALHGLLALSPSLPATPLAAVSALGNRRTVPEPGPAPTAHCPSTPRCYCSITPGSKARPGPGSAPHPHFPLTRGSGPMGDRLEISRLAPEASHSCVCRGHSHPPG